MINMELDKKSYEKELEDIADRRIELIRMEKDQQFVETMQKVRSDMKRRHKVEIARLKQELRDASIGVGQGGDNGVEDENLEQLQKLNEENKVCIEKSSLTLCILGILHAFCHLLIFFIFFFFFQN